MLKSTPLILAMIVCLMSNTARAMDFATRSLAENRQAIPCDLDFMIKIKKHLVRYCIYLHPLDEKNPPAVSTEVLIELAKDMILTNPSEEVSGLFYDLDSMPGHSGGFKLTAIMDMLVMLQSL